MSLYKTFIPVTVIFLLLASCAPASPAASNTPVPNTAAPKTAEPSVSESVPSSPPASESALGGYPSASPIDPDSEGYKIIPGSLPSLTRADRNIFNPDKAYSYLADDNALSSLDYSYDISKAEVKDGELYVFLTLEISLADVNSAYKDLKEKHSLADKAIISIPDFSGCVIDGGVMYADKDACSPAGVTIRMTTGRKIITALRTRWTALINLPLKILPTYPAMRI